MKFCHRQKQTQKKFCLFDLSQTNKRQRGKSRLLYGCAAIPGPPSTQTPRIRLWHEPETQQVQWFAINDSFGTNGADTLWGLTPALEDIATAVGDEERVVMHCILEAGANSPGLGGDAIPFLDLFLESRISFLGVEPVVFAQEVSPGTWQVTKEDAVVCSKQMKNIYHAGP